MPENAHDVGHIVLITIVMAISGGALLMGLAQKLRIPAIVILLAGGILCGPEGLNLIQPDSLGAALGPIVSLAVGLILFEAGMTLDLNGYRTASTVIQRLLTFGTLITWIGSAAAIHYILGHSVTTSLLAASLVIVTGPTVIVPLLKRIRVEPRVHHILQWEGVLIDPIGVFVAVLCFEWLSSGSGWSAAQNFAVRFAAGAIIGGLGGLLIYLVIKRRLTPPDMAGAVSLGGATLTFGIAETAMSESGLLAAIAAGLVLAFLKPAEMRHIIKFKTEVTDLLIAILFMLLAARLELDQFKEFGFKGWLVVAIVMVVVRPINILVCTFRQGLNWREKSFLMWLAPRGIVAASMASLFRLALEERQLVSNPEFVETFTYSVILATILIEGLGADLVARALKLKRPQPVGWLIVGAHRFGRAIASHLKSAGIQVALIDSNPRLVRTASDSGLDAYHADARDNNILEREGLLATGNVLALTDNEDLNLVVCARMAETIKPDNVYAWVSPRGGETQEQIHAGKLVWEALPKPSVLSREIDERLSLLVEADAIPTGPGLSALVAIRNNEVIIEPTANLTGGKWKYLVLQRDTNYLMRAIDPRLIILTRLTSINSVLREGLERMATVHPGLDVEEVLANILQREQLYPTILGYQVAIPHAYSTALQERTCCVIQSAEPIRFGYTTEAPEVRLIILLISPASDPQGHLATLADLARFVRNEPLREAVMAADTAQDLHRIFQQWTLSS